MKTHIFAVCAYGDSPYLEECILSLKKQTLPAKIIICTSTPRPCIKAVAEKYSLPLYVRDGASDIQDDWNFAYNKADAELVTIAHQDDQYCPEYLQSVRDCWERWPDTTVFTTDCTIVKNGVQQPTGTINRVKRLLRAPLRNHARADRRGRKRAVLRFGNPIICPSCTYNKAVLGTPLFTSEYKFVLDWDTMWKLADIPGRFYCAEKPLMLYRVHDGSETKKCIQDNRRASEELSMYNKIWPKPVSRLLMLFYKKAYSAYD